MPALLKAFLEQVFRPDFVFRYGDRTMPEKLLTGRSARVIVTMGMPRAFYELFYRAHSVKSLGRNILKFVGIGLVKHTIVGCAEAGDTERRRWLKRIEALGARAVESDGTRSLASLLAIAVSPPSL
jgi:putative NADPH-quinone reductase